MDLVKTRKVGNSLTITIPKRLEVEEGAEFAVYRGIDGAIVLAPKILNPFDQYEDLRMEDDFEGVVLLDEE